MRSTSGSFSWSERFDELLNYWIWLRGLGDLSDEAVRTLMQEWAGQEVLNRPPSARGASRWPEFLRIWSSWKTALGNAQIDDSGQREQSTLRNHYEAVASVRLQAFRVEWVMAPIGERWLFPPDLAVMGVEGSTVEARMAAVLDAARALRG